MHRDVRKARLLAAVSAFLFVMALFDLSMVIMGLSVAVVVHDTETSYTSYPTPYPTSPTPVPASGRTFEQKLVPRTFEQKLVFEPSMTASDPFSYMIIASVAIPFVVWYIRNLIDFMGYFWLACRCQKEFWSSEPALVVEDETRFEKFIAFILAKIFGAGEEAMEKVKIVTGDNDATFEAAKQELSASIDEILQNSTAHHAQEQQERDADLGAFAALKVALGAHPGTLDYASLDNALDRVVKSIPGISADGLEKSVSAKAFSLGQWSNDIRLGSETKELRKKVLEVEFVRAVAAASSLCVRDVVQDFARFMLYQCLTGDASWPDNLVKRFTGQAIWNSSNKCNKSALEAVAKDLASASRKGDDWGDALQFLLFGLRDANAEADENAHWDKRQSTVPMQSTSSLTKTKSDYLHPESEENSVDMRVNPMRTAIEKVNKITTI